MEGENGKLMRGNVGNKEGEHGKLRRGNMGN